LRADVSPIEFDGIGCGAAARMEWRAQPPFSSPFPRHHFLSRPIFLNKREGWKSG
jgi:hypothetical protein